MSDKTCCPYCGSDAFQNLGTFKCGTDKYADELRDGLCYEREIKQLKKKIEELEEELEDWQTGNVWI